MKKTFLVLFLAVAMLLMAASVALASAGDSTYLAAGGGSPHGDYTTASKKCAVCHAVHHAGDGNTGAEALLRSTKNNACTFCHITNDISSLEVYGGLEANYTSDYQNAHSNAGSTPVGCKDCHQVHGATNDMTASTLLSASILKEQGANDLVGYTAGRLPTAANALVTTVGADGALTYDDQLAKWCSGCHGYYNTTADDAGQDFTSHVMKAKNDTTAYLDSTYCKSCHNSLQVGGVAVPSAFPHYTDGARFLTSAASSAVASTAVTTGNTNLDAVCLRCHRNGTIGVGVNF